MVVSSSGGEAILQLPDRSQQPIVLSQTLLWGQSEHGVHQRGIDDRTIIDDLRRMGVCFASAHGSFRL
jgi:hypothetical protein